MAASIIPDFAFESQTWNVGALRVAGVDEVGRGPLAGPVIAAAVILPCFADFPWLSQVRDSKALSAKVREQLAQQILAHALAGLGSVPPETIDDIGIGAASLLAMRIAVEALPVAPDSLLVDGRIKIPDVSVPQRAIIDGDALCLSIACASIVAKVERDHIMIEYDSLYPGYGLAAHKGYPTTEHKAALLRLGATPIHRRSFYPVRAVAEIGA